MSSEKPKKAAASPKVFDVAKPDKSAPSASSKPIIITNRPILKDPMVIDDDSSSNPSEVKGEETQTPLTAPSLSKVKIEPPKDEEESAPVAKVSKESVAQKITVKTSKSSPKAVESKDDPAESSLESATSSAETTGAAEFTAPKPPTDEAKAVAASEESAAEQTAASEDNSDTAKTEPTPESAAETPAATDEAKQARGPEAADSQNTEDNAPAEGDADSKKNEKDDEEEERKKTERQAELDKMAESKQYYLPINEVAKRRHFYAVGFLIALVLGAAWLDVMLDAGIITIPGVKAPTHFFSSKPAAASTVATKTASQPAQQLATYISPVDTVSFSYPKTWKIAQVNGISAEDKDVTPPASLLGSLKFAGVNFTRDGDIASGQTTYPPVKSTSARYILAAVSYQKLPKSPTDLPLYLEQFVVQDNTTSTPIYYLGMNVTNNNNLKVGDYITGGGSGIVDYQPFRLTGDNDGLLFYAGFTPTNSGVAGGFTSLQVAQSIQSTNATYKAAKTILLSFQPSQL